MFSASLCNIAVQIAERLDAWMHIVFPAGIWGRQDGVGGGGGLFNLVPAASQMVHVEGCEAECEDAGHVDQQDLHAIGHHAESVQQVGPDAIIFHVVSLMQPLAKRL